MATMTAMLPSRRALFLCCLLACGVQAAAHEDSWSRSRVRVDGDTVELQLLVQTRSVVEVLDVDGDGDGRLDAAELAAGSAVLEVYLREHFELRVDSGGDPTGGRVLTGESSALSVRDAPVFDDEPEARQAPFGPGPPEQWIAARWRATSERDVADLMLTMTLFFATSAGHRDLDELIWNGQPVPLTVFWMADHRKRFAPTAQDLAELAELTEPARTVEQPARQPEEAASSPTNAAGPRDASRPPDAAGAMLRPSWSVAIDVGLALLVLLLVAASRRAAWAAGAGFAGLHGLGVLMAVPTDTRVAAGLTGLALLVLAWPPLASSLRARSLGGRPLVGRSRRDRLAPAAPLANRAEAPPGLLDVPAAAAWGAVLGALSVLGQPPLEAGRDALLRLAPLILLGSLLPRLIASTNGVGVSDRRWQEHDGSGGLATSSVEARGGHERGMTRAAQPQPEVRLLSLIAALAAVAVGFWWLRRTLA